MSKRAKKAPEPAPAPPTPTVKATRYEMSFTCMVDGNVNLVVGGPIVRDVAPIYVRND